MKGARVLLHPELTSSEIFIMIHQEFHEFLSFSGPVSQKFNTSSLSHRPLIIIRSRRQQRSVASTHSGHDDEPWTIQHERWRVYRRRSAGSMNGAGVLAVAANQDQNGSRFLLLRPVIMRGELACGHRVSPHGRTMSFVYRRWDPEHRESRPASRFLRSSKPTEIDPPPTTSY